MRNFSRHGLRRGHTYAFMMASVALVGLAPAAHAQAVGTTPAVDTTADTNTNEIVVIGSGQTRSVSTLLPSNLDIFPPLAPACRRR